MNTSGTVQETNPAVPRGPPASSDVGELASRTYLWAACDAERCEPDTVNGQRFHYLIGQLGTVRDVQEFQGQ